MEKTLKGRRCMICGKIGGMGSTTILRMLGYDIPVGQIGYAHSSCFQKARKKKVKDDTTRRNARSDS